MGSSSCYYTEGEPVFTASVEVNREPAAQVEVNGEYVRFLGRRSEIINIGGEKVYPAEVENVLMQMPNIRDVVVTGEPNPLTGKIVAAHFCLKEPEPLSVLRRRMREHCRGLLEPYKIPAKVEIVAEEQHSERFKKNRRRPLPVLAGTPEAP